MNIEFIPLILKVVFSAVILVSASWLAGKNPVLAGFIIALPLMSMLSILFSYIQYRDMAKINEFAVSILVAVPLSMTFFIPFVLNKWLKLGFIPTYGFGVAFLTAAFFAHNLILRSGFFR